METTKENQIEVQLQTSDIDAEPVGEGKVYDFDKVIFDLDSKLDLLTSHADALDYTVAAASGLLCSMLDIFWVGDFNLAEGREIASKEVDKFVEKTAGILGCKKTDVNSCVKFLEKRFPLASDGNTPDFGGGKQHHLRDFAHHPTIVGLFFSLLTQWTEKSYGTDPNGVFLVCDVPEASKAFIGKDPVSKVLFGTVIWFFHLVSDMAGSKDTAGFGGGTGIPGPILSLAKEISIIPLFYGEDGKKNTFSVLLSKYFNGTKKLEKDENGKIIKDTIVKMDFRGELGALIEIGKQAMPVIANECIVRLFYAIRQFATEVKRNDIRDIKGLKAIDWEKVAPIHSPTLTRMLTIASGVFTTVDVTDAVLKKKYWVAVNYVGIVRLTLAIGDETAWALKRKNLSSTKKMYEEIKRNTFTDVDGKIYRRIEKDMNAERLGLTLEQTEILYNIEYQKTLNDIEAVKLPAGSEMVRALKKEWLSEWASYMEKGFASFLNIDGAKLHWYSAEELQERIKNMEPEKTWYKLVLLEAVVFEPYFALSTEKDKKGNDVPSKKYDALSKPLLGYNSKTGDKYLEEVFSVPYCKAGLIERFRKCYDKALDELGDVLKSKLLSLAIATIVVVAFTGGAALLAGKIAAALVGSQFVGLGGAALTNACLAFLGGGAISAGGFGVLGGTAVIVGGGSILGLGIGAGVGGIASAISISGKKMTILQSAKLMVSVREIFLNEEKDVEFSSSVYEQYVNNIMEIEKGITELKLKADIADKTEKKELEEKIKSAEESAKAMKVAMKSMNKYISAYKVGIGVEE